MFVYDAVFVRKLDVFSFSTAKRFSLFPIQFANFASGQLLRRDY